MGKQSRETLAPFKITLEEWNNMKNDLNLQKQHIIKLEIKINDLVSLLNGLIATARSNVSKEDEKDVNQRKD